MTASPAGQSDLPPPKRWISPRWNYPAVDVLVDDLVEISTMTPAELKRYSGEW